MSCLSENDATDFVQGILNPEARKAIQNHIARCENCRILISETVKFFQEQPGSPGLGGDPGNAGGSAKPRPEHISRYVIERTLGAGATGLVYEAFDPQLKRAVALKLLRAESGTTATQDKGSDRLLREAEVMARLSHPNVVQVYDSGRIEGQVFVAMELVRGQTLADWLTQRPRTWQEILAVFIDAAQGLAAAHAADIVHGDFKPENVLVSADGRARVTDFGLSRRPSRNVSVLQSGTNPIAGTPIYMSPEQLRGAGLDARSDQFSFCVALYVALYGVHPFGEKAIGALTLFGLASRVLSGRPRATPRRTDIPAWVHAALLKGMSLAPEQRHATMEVLALALTSPAAIASPPARRRWRTVAAVAVAFSFGGLMAWRFLGPIRSDCGNQVVEPGEECDDGNPSDDDGCLQNCRRSRCGDGTLRVHVEECDDGNLVDDDSCNRFCARPCRGGAAAVTWIEAIPSGDEFICYERHDAAETWEGAQRACWARAGSLVTYGSETEAHVVTQGLFATALAPTWLGMKRDGEDFAWITGIVRAFRAWDEGQPDRTAGRDCVIGARGAYGWRTAACQERHGFVCERSPWALNPRDNHAYSTIQEPLPWDEARRRCQDLGGHLVTVANSEEQVFLSKGFARRFLYWLGGRHASRGGPLRWITGERTQFAQYDPTVASAGSSTGVSAPDAAGCLAMGVGGFWRILPCDERHSSVCEID